MILACIIVAVFGGGILAWISSRWSQWWPRWISLGVLSASLITLIALWIKYFGRAGVASRGPWLVEIDRAWIPQLGIHFHLAMDGLSLLFLVLTNFVGIIAVAASWNSVKERVGFFHFNLLWILAAIMGVFVAVDLFLFYFFWEMMLVPLYFLIGIWGYENRTYASIKFFLFTQAGGVLMLVGILGLYFVHGRATGVYTFNYSELLGTPMAEWTARWLMLGFLAAFAIKLPVVPLHTWLPDAHTQAPTAGSVILAGLVLKAGAYGMIRFLLPLFPDAALDFQTIAMAIAVVSILYGAVLAFAQTDIKRLVAYTSVSHMGFVLLGIFAWNELALQGAVMIMLAHALSTGALFIIVGDLQQRIHTRDISQMEGLWATVPKMSGIALFFAVASLGLPGLGNFVGEFLVVLGAYQSNLPLAVLATLGLIFSAVYSLWMVQAVFQGPNTHQWKLPDISLREAAILLSMAGALIWFGLYPKTVLSTVKDSIHNLQQSVSSSQAQMPSATLPLEDTAAGAQGPSDSGGTQ